MLKDILLVGTGGFAGSVLRYLVSAAMLPIVARMGFPLGTFGVNAAGSLLIGILFAALPAGGWHTLLVAGFCGGFTTFSAFSLESLKMLRGGQYGMAALYIAASLAVCLLFVWLGALIGSKVAKTI